MKRLFIYTILVLAMIGCGSNGTKYSVTDDENGTRSPRISKVEINYDENNISAGSTMLYSYNKENLLMQKKEQYYNKAGELVEGRSIEFTYNDKRELNSIHWHSSTNIFDGGSVSRFIYAETLYYQTKLPIVMSNEQEWSGPAASHGSSIIDYEYEYNDEGEAMKLMSSVHTEKSSTLYLDSDSIGKRKPFAQYIYDENGKIIQKIENHAVTVSTIYTYNMFGKLDTEKSDTSIVKYTYDKHGALTASKEYRILESGEKELLETKKYIYENKPYYSNPSPSYLDQGQYSSSGIY